MSVRLGCVCWFKMLESKHSSITTLGVCLIHRLSVTLTTGDTVLSIVDTSWLDGVSSHIKRIKNNPDLRCQLLQLWTSLALEGWPFEAETHHYGFSPPGTCGDQRLPWCWSILLGPSLQPWSQGPSGRWSGDMVAWLICMWARWMCPSGTGHWGITILRTEGSQSELESKWR